MRVAFESRGGALVVRPLEPELDVGNARAFKDAITSACGERLLRVVIDLSAVREIDSSGLGALIAVLKWVRNRGGGVRLAAVPPGVRAVIELTMLQRVLPLHATVEEAMKSTLAGEPGR